MQKLKQAAVRGSAANLITQGVNAAIRIGTMVAFARLLDPNDFGIVAMVTSIVSVLNMFRDFGLSTATIQRASISEEQLSALFWINILVGVLLMILTLSSASSIAAFYREPRLFWIAVALASTFVLNAVGIQHAALLQRQMRFTELAFIGSAALVLSTLLGFVMAIRGFGYWALVGMNIASVMAYSGLAWWKSGWRPGRPRRATEVGSMMKVGGVVTANGVIMYVANNLDKVLLGRFWGADALGTYGRAQTLLSFPTESLNSAVSTVLLSALSRVKEERERWRKYFLKGYSLLLAISFPITAVCALFAEEIILTVLGPKWTAAIPFFRYLAPTVLVFGMINPLWPLLISMNLLKRSLRMALVLGPMVIVGFCVGMQWGAVGSAIGLSTSLMIWVVPHLAWAVRGTPVSIGDILEAAARPLACSLVAAICAGISVNLGFESLGVVGRLLVGGATFCATYAILFGLVMKQWSLFAEVLGSLRGGARTVEEQPATV